MEFTPENIRKVFGHEAAEDDNLENLYNFYVKGSAYKTLKSDVPLQMAVGHKGTGKSAVLTILEAEEKSAGHLPITIRPDDIFEQTETDINKMITIWQEKLAEIIFTKLIENLVVINENNNDKGFKSWLSSFSKLVFTIVGKKFSDLKKEKFDIPYVKFLSLFKNSLFQERRVTVFIDDLDRGWKNEVHEIRNISAMLNAIRSISRSIPQVRFKVALRSSVYYAVRTSDESTDKIEGSVVWIKWSNYEILLMLVKRIILFTEGKSIDESILLQKRQQDLGAYLDSVFEKSFQGSGHWENAPMYRVLLSLIRQRPRDLIKLCSLAANVAYSKGHKVIMTSDLEAIFNQYSQGRLTDTINEYASELNEVALKKILLEMRPTVKKKGSFLYNPQELSEKMNSIIAHIGQVRFSNGDNVTVKNLPIFLYKINFFTGRKKGTNEIVRYYFDENNYIFSEGVNFGFDVEVHPAYRWVLQPVSQNDIYRQIDLLTTLEDVKS